MKIKYLLIAALAGVALVGCNKETNVDDNATDGARKYMGFQIRVPSEGATKAEKTGNGGYTNGTKEEQDINSLYFYFYKDGAYITYGKGEVHGAFQKEEQDPDAHGPIEAIWGKGNEGKGVVVIESIMNVQPNQVICVANSAKPDFFRHKSLNDVIDALATGDNGVTGSAAFAELGFGQLPGDGKIFFTMTNSPVFEDGKEVYAISIDETKLKDSEKDAEEDPVDVYIERMAAKVEVTSLAVKSDAMAQNYDITLDGWALNAVATQGYFMKNIDQAWKTADWAQNWLIGVDNRINWAKDPHYSPAEYAFLGEEFYPTSAENLGRYAQQSHVLQYYTWDQLTEHSRDAASSMDKLRRTYCLENTFNAEGQADARKVGTSMMVLATVKLKGQQAQDLYDYNGNVYTLEDYLDHMLANVQTNYTFYVKDGDDYKVLSKNHVKASDIKKAVKVTGDATKNFDLAANQNCNNYSDGYVTVDPSGLKKLYEWSAAEGQYVEADDAHVTQAFFKDIPDIANMYKGGKMWYAIPVEHLGSMKSTDSKALPLEGNYGIVRNNYYKITLGDLLSLGHGVFDPTEPIVPGEKADKWYLGARVNVNAWNIVTQTSNLQE